MPELRHWHSEQICRHSDADIQAVKFRIPNCQKKNFRPFDAEFQTAYIEFHIRNTDFQLPNAAGKY